MFVFSGTRKEPTVESTEQIIAKLDSAGRSHVDAVRKTRIETIRSVKKASGAVYRCNDRVAEQMIESAVRKEAKLQAMRQQKREKRVQDRLTLLRRARYESSKEYRQQSEEYKQQCRDEMARFAFSMF